MKNMRCLFVTFIKETTLLTKIMRLGVAALVFAVGLDVWAARVEAYTYWMSNGGGCVPEDSAIANDLYWTVTGGMRVKFRPNKTGTIRLVCPITTPDITGANTLYLYYQDPDGFGTTYRVQASLRSVRFSDGAYGTLCTADSNSYYSMAMWSVTTCHLPSVLSPDTHAYWVEVLITASAAAKTVELNAVKLVYVEP